MIASASAIEVDFSVVDKLRHLIYADIHAIVIRQVECADPSREARDAALQTARRTHRLVDIDMGTVVGDELFSTIRT